MSDDQLAVGTVTGSSADLQCVAEAHVIAGRYDEAVRIYQELLATDPDHIGVLLGLGDLCILVHDSVTASIFFRRVLTLDPTDTSATRALARIAMMNSSGMNGEGRPAPRQTVLRPIPLWETDTRFVQIMNQITFSLVDRIRCFMLYQFALQAARIEGDVAEIGVYKGGTARLLATAFEASGKELHLFDTFDGMPSTDPGRDSHRRGDFSDTSLDSVKKNMSGCGNVFFHPGFFPATAPPVVEKKFCLAHVDVDIYRSVLDCCEFFYPRMVAGGMMVFDDYGFESCPGAKEAVDEFFSATKERPCYLPSGQCVVTKL